MDMVKALKSLAAFILGPDGRPSASLRMTVATIFLNIFK